jgi:hypothetical protein
MTTATISTLDGSKAYSFLINPETLEYSYGANFSTLGVLGTAQPLVSYQFSQGSLSIPRVMLLTPGNAQSILGALETLAGWTQPGPNLVPEVLKFTWGQQEIPRCYLESWEYTVSRWRDGLPTSAQGSLRLLYAPEVPEEVRVDVVELTEREISEITPRLQEYFGSDQVTLTPDGQVTVDGQPQGDYREIID